ncbi:M16 family metallopeptidase [Moellerella wisconsensis]|uniref:Insulinase family protein n=1 Tax=Moellerella wisconsensis TaxID=158849 RepID=A0ACD3Y7U0_9GAMM|nr:insulinase family protein [Moellerella wisconsensis]UNH39105.1 insulinase family protein [Moellerella wisconsensis]
MQGMKVRYYISGLLLSVAGVVSAEPLQPDPAWQQGKLENGFSWQLLQTPQRPNDRVQLRLAIKTGSLTEDVSEKGYSYLIPKMALYQPTESLPAEKLQNLWRNAIDPTLPMPPAVVSYDFTLYSLSLPNNKPELLKDALKWLAESAAGGQFTQQALQTALTSSDIPVATLPMDVNDPVWRVRLKGSSMVGYDPGLKPTDSVNINSLNQFYQKWYTPDMMTLYIAGHVDGRMLSDVIQQNFASLEGKRSEPVPVASLSPLKPQAVNLLTDREVTDSLALIWDIDWLPIKDSRVLKNYWQQDIAREALYRSLQQVFAKKFAEEVRPELDCRVQYQRASCTLTIFAPADKMAQASELLMNELASINKNGIAPELFDSMIQEKQSQLSQLFAAYARTSTDVLINQRLTSQQNNVIDIAPEQYQRFRQAFLAIQNLEQMNMEVRRLLSQEPALVLVQPRSKQLLDAEQLRLQFEKVLWPQEVVTPQSTTSTLPPVNDENKS